MKETLKKLRGKTGAKVTAWILLFLFSAIGAAGIFSAYFMLQEDFYRIPEPVRQEQERTNSLETEAFWILNDHLNDIESDYTQTNITGYRIKQEDGEPIRWGADPGQSPYTYSMVYQAEPDGSGYRIAFEDEPWPHRPAKDAKKRAEVTISIDPNLSEHDNLYLEDRLIHLCYVFRYHVYWITFLAIVLACLSIFFLTYAAGCKPDDRVKPWISTKIPADLFYTANVFLLLFLLYLGLGGIFLGNELILFLIPALFCAVLLSMEFAMRIRTKTLLSDLFFPKIIRFGSGQLQTLFHRIGQSCAKVLQIFAQIPLIGKGVACYLALALLQFFAGLLLFGPDGRLLIFWMAEQFLFFPPFVLCLLMMRRLESAAVHLAEGNLTQKVDTDGLLWNFKTHGENLNRIADGMAKAVEEQIKSEHLKTELIANVSHDLKTPLTSIINYSDLIGKEKTDLSQIHRYAEILERQSLKLKHLLEDLIEVSKASTGNLELELADCNVKVLLMQAAGEYKERLEKNGLKLIVESPETDVRIRADGRRLWRVLDNLLNNILKYSMPGTRVYLTLQETPESCEITFKNTSREELNLTPEELTERFVRGDQARTGNGNGLGLAIAKNLCELQNGSLTIQIDGDLFKAILRFPKMTEKNYA